MTCDINDEIVELQSSLMVGVARHVAESHQKQTSHYKEQQLGVLNNRECRDLIKALN
jgi:hypothetical protein